MARPREFDEDAVLDAVVRCFWTRGYEATSIRHLIENTGLTGASIYNAFGDKRALYQRALEHYVEGSIGERMTRCQAMEARAAIEVFLNEIVKRSLDDQQHRGCMLVNAALDVTPRDPDFQTVVASVFSRIEAFFLRCIRRGQADGSIGTMFNAEDLARHLLGVLMGVRVLARVRPERALLEGVIGTALALLEPKVNMVGSSP